MMKLLVDAGELMAALAADLSGARKSAVAQAMTFEGDHAGRRLANLLICSRCRDRRLIVDAFSRHVISGCLVHPLVCRDAELRNEVEATAATHEALRRAGVRVRFCNPAGRFMRRFAARDHKKIIVVDGRISYIGGINFSDHNFGWHDLMLRIESDAVAGFLTDDVDATWRGSGAGRWETFDRIAIGSLDGRNNAKGFTPVFDLIASARAEIVIETPYLTFPFTDHLSDARRRGVRVRVIAPAAHPQPSFGRYLEWECSRNDFDLRLVPGMTHVKAMLVDGRTLVLGSSNFDFLSHSVLREIVAIVDDPGIVADFVRRVAAVDLARSTPARPAFRPWIGYVRRRFMETAGGALVWISGA